MASARNPLNDFVLTPQQQSLLFAALNSNRPASGTPNSGFGPSPSTVNQSPLETNDGASFQESPFLDYELDFGGADSSFDFSFDNGNGAKMIGDLPGTSTPKSDTKSDSPESETPDKRSHPDDDDDDEPNGGGKRRESEEKVPKKPGRKPLTTEPSSKRKAQNRAAQRAFRERKEKHLKDLETKVSELEKASQATNNENEVLRAKVDRMTVELNEYKKRVTLMATSRSSSQGPPKPFGQPFINNINDVNFQFEFPKFGALPGPPVTSTEPTKSSPAMPLNRANSDQLSPRSEASKDAVSPANSSTYSQVGLDSQAKEDLANILGAAASTSSPSASSNSNAGASSSCGTSPEPSTQSPTGFKPVDTLTTIGEESNALSTVAKTSLDFGHFANMEMNFNWLPENNFQFDPQLFGGYREPQENVLSLGYDDSFFNDAFDVDFTTPYNVPVAPVPKKDLLAQIDAAKESDDPNSSTQLLTCNKIWERLQACPKVQNGDFDLDGLCSDLQKKAKCSGSGAVVDEKDFKNVMKKYLGKSDGDMSECPLEGNATTA
ncbi:PAP1-domain-containing protein [Thozetella sp. PMI_491]|nr:PAP1-domain-containing protein [Thozetella sp. PMI_491]